MCKPIPQYALFKLRCQNKLITLPINDQNKGMTSEVGPQVNTLVRIQTHYISVGKCKEMNPNTPKWVLILGVGVLWASQIFGTRF
jgi:hypothetical protein